MTAGPARDGLLRLVDAAGQPLPDLGARHRRRAQGYVDPPARAGWRCGRRLYVMPSRTTIAVTALAGLVCLIFLLVLALSPDPARPPAPPPPPPMVRYADSDTPPLLGTGGVSREPLAR